MRIRVKIGAIAAAGITVLGLSSGVASAGTATFHPVHVLKPDVHQARGGRAAVDGQGLPIQYSGNWSGYIALPKSGGASSFKHIAATYTVPSANCGVTNTAFAYQWIGLDGDTDGTVEQDGVASYCVSGSPTYFAWSEMYPAGVDVQFYLNPGDAVSSSVTYSTQTGEYTLALDDLTSGQSFSTVAACASTCNNASAEAITEGYPSGSYGGTSDFGAENYAGITITANTGTKGGLTNAKWSTDESIATGAGGDDFTTEPGPLYSSTNPSAPHYSAFTDYWLSED